MAAGLVGRRKPSSFKCLHEALEISPTSLTIEEEEEEEEEFCRATRISVKAERVHQPRWAVSAWPTIFFSLSLLSTGQIPNGPGRRLN